jgi:hypothetical protein
MGQAKPCPISLGECREAINLLRRVHTMLFFKKKDYLHFSCLQSPKAELILCIKLSMEYLALPMIYPIRTIF